MTLLDTDWVLRGRISSGSAVGVVREVVVEVSVSEGSTVATDGGVSSGEADAVGKSAGVSSVVGMITVTVGSMPMRIAESQAVRLVIDSRRSTKRVTARIVSRIGCLMESLLPRRTHSAG